MQEGLTGAVTFETHQQARKRVEPCWPVATSLRSGQRSVGGSDFAPRYPLEVKSWTAGLTTSVRFIEISCPPAPIV